MKGSNYIKNIIRISDPEIKIEWMSGSTSNEGRSWTTKYKLKSKFDFAVEKFIVVIPYREQMGCIPMQRPVTESVNFSEEKEFIRILERYLPLATLKQDFSFNEPFYIRKYSDGFELRLKKDKIDYMSVFYDLNCSKFDMEVWSNFLSFAKLFCPLLLRDKTVISFVGTQPQDVSIFAWNFWQIYGKELSWVVYLEKNTTREKLNIKIEENKKIKVLYDKKISTQEVQEIVIKTIPYEEIKKIFNLKEDLPTIRQEENRPYGFISIIDLPCSSETGKQSWIYLKYFYFEDIVKAELRGLPFEVFCNLFCPGILNERKIEDFVNKHKTKKIFVDAKTDFQIPRRRISDWDACICTHDESDWIDVIIVDGKVVKIKTKDD